MTNIGHRINSADARCRQIRVMQLIFAGAATVATLALSSAGPSDPQTTVASGPTLATAGRIIAVNDDDVNNPSDGDIFTQNAQDQSTANGAGT
jgi:hypothetical protein